MTPATGLRAATGTNLRGNLAEAVLAGDRLALARLLSRIENGDREGLEGLNALYAHAGKAHRVGVTGPPGTGKSTLVNRLAAAFRSPSSREAPPAVGVVAVDLSSPFTGGAILGDRIRMTDLAGDPGVFIRSMASRGALGGLSRTTGDFVEALDAAGFGLVLIETVGAGQAEVDIARTAHTTIVVEAPGLGDDVQAIKAGILEAADILVVNKADLPGAEATLRALRTAIDLGYPHPRESEDSQSTWVPPVLATSALTGEGIAELKDAIERHRAHLNQTGEGTRRERQRRRDELEACLREQSFARVNRRLPDGRLDRALTLILSRRRTPWQAAQELLAEQEN
jgi:LAO/AO transport system kinase